MIRWILSLSLLLAGSAAQAAYCTGADLRETLSAGEQAQIAQAMGETPYAAGNHWIARKGDQTIHVMGTMHLDDPRWDSVLPALLPVVQAADLLFVEMTDEEQMAMQAALAEQPEKVFITEGPTLPELLSEEDWERLASAMRERGLPGFMAAKMQPWMQTLMLGMPGCAIANPELAKGGLDMRLMEAARDADVPVRSLEGFEELYALIADGTVEEQLQMLMATLPFAHDSEDQFMTTSYFYFDEQTAAAWEFARVMSHRRSELPPEQVEALLEEFKTKLLDTRNHAWMDPILSARESTIVVAVGALHLMGEDGVLNLLDQAGYRLDRAAFTGQP
ncbi:TraB/GumN family protein [Aestuariivita boseongensis]|uniref:TraB/GumN family protein n=1 Tax=Aestuariivita boseongensis TaxID=1470562 RepID=UPI000680E643|nr:TraB/GumN family protein [Aestuariivita boseongensis]